MTTRRWPSALRRVVFVTTDFPAMAGGAVYVESMAGAFSERGLAVDVLSIYPGPGATAVRHRSVYPDRALYKEPALAGKTGWSKVRALPRWVGKRLTKGPLSRRAADWLQTFGSDSLVIFTHVAALAHLIEAGYDPSRSSAALVGQHHSSFSMLDMEPHLVPLMRDHFSQLDAFTALSDEDAALFETLIGVPSVGMPNPLRPHTPQPRTPPHARPPHVIGLARFAPEKRLELMADLADRMFDDDRITEWSLHLYGDGPNRCNIVARADGSRHRDRITVHPPTIDPIGVLSQARLHLVTSSYEGFSLSTLEAASQGVPTVAFDVSPGLRALVTSTGGVLIPDGDEEAFIATVVRLMVDERELVARSRLALEGSRGYHGEQIVDRWADLLTTYRGDTRPQSRI